MASENFVDYVKICCRSGKGGAGSAHFMRNRVTAKGGPDGGDGGRGGHVIARGNSQFWTLHGVQLDVRLDARLDTRCGARLVARLDARLDVPLAA